MSLLTDLQAALPGLVVSAPDVNNVTFTRALTTQEWALAQAILDPAKGKAAQGKLDILAIPTWATWTQAQFIAWCDANLMTDAQVDAATLSAALKTNIKAINLFVRNGGKMLVALRDSVLWILKIVGVNGA